MARLQTRYRDIYVVIYTGNPTTINAMEDGDIATETMPYHPATSEEWRIVGRRMNSVITKLIKKH